MGQTTGQKKEEVLKKGEEGAELTRPEVSLLASYAHRVLMEVEGLSKAHKDSAYQEGGLGIAEQRAKRIRDLLQTRRTNEGE